MLGKTIRLAGLAGLLLLFLQVAPALAHGDKIIPHVPDGTGSDGTGYKTKFDFTNLGPVNANPASFPITNVKVLFFQPNGSPRTIATNLGTASEFTLNIGRFSTLHLETLGTSSQITGGYVIVRNLEKTTIFSEDYEVSISAFYEVSKNGQVIDTVSVSTAQATVAWFFPVQIENSTNLHTGFAVVNLLNTTNQLTLQLWKAGTPVSNDATDGGTVTVPLAAGEQRATFLYPSIFAGQSSFKGMLWGYSQGPVAILALLQSPTPTGVQYATMAPAYADALRRNTYMYLRQGYPLDADLPVSDYFYADLDDAPWDLLYVGDSSTTRHLEPQQGAGFAVLGLYDNDPFDAITIETLRGLTYGTSNIDLSNNSTSLAPQFTFAIRTGLGRYVKIRIADVITRDTNKDLALEVYVFK